MSQRNRNACCSFCRKNYRDVGPLVEGPGEVYICGDCIELCQSIIDQENRRRSHGVGTPAVQAAEAICVWSRIDLLLAGQRQPREVLVRAAADHYKRSGSRPRDAVLLIGQARSSKVFLARALAHALEVPFAEGDKAALVKAPGVSEVDPLLHRLLLACDFYLQTAQRGIVYVDGIDQEPTQKALLKLWEEGSASNDACLRVDVGELLVVCGGEFTGLDQVIAGVGGHPEQPVTKEDLVTFGVAPQLVAQFRGIARVAPLDEASLVRIVPLVDFARLEGGNP
jgi:ATP-dependent Clp protease ATP-binding subunit ClpX